MMRHRDDGGQVALVTGGSSGIGFATARFLAARGLTVWIGARDRDRLEQSGDAIGPDRTVVRSVDVSSEQEVAALVSEIEAVHGQLDVLVNAAGVCRLATVEQTAVDDWLEMISANVTGTFLCCREVVPMMKRQGSGRIVNIGSVVGGQPTAGVSGYGATKAAVIALTRALALELAGTGVLVHLVCPTGVDTPMRRAVDQSDPSGWIKPDEVARVISDIIAYPAGMMVDTVSLVPGHQT